MIATDTRCPRCESTAVEPFLNMDMPKPDSGLLSCSSCGLLGTPTAMRVK